MTTDTEGNLLCDVPFCGAFIKPRIGRPFKPGQWWVCRDHWRETSKLGRKRWKAARRRGMTTVATRMAWKLRCEAIERAFGIG